ncbi:MAG TPA: hypothetical protein VGM84_01130 [Steroidobacteraceae bacterium]|jgi:ABC-2 type transport system permease protein
MNEMTADTGRAVADTSAPPAIPLWRTLLMLVKREFWEHRQLWLVPVSVGGLLVLAGMFAQFNTGGDFRLPFGPQKWHWDTARQVGEHEAMVAFSSVRLVLSMIPLVLTGSIALYFYLLNSLFDERKDRSILFWKSLPVSDGATVVSKLLVGTVITPLLFYAVAVVTQVLFAEVWNLRLSWGLASGAAFAWDATAWFKLQGFMLFSVLGAILWYAPVAGYLVFISAWARRQPFLWSILPLIALGFIEQYVLGTRYIATLVGYRMAGLWAYGNDPGGWSVTDAAIVGPGHHIQTVDFSNVFDHQSLIGMLSRPGVLIGLVVAVGFAYAAARVRRFRDDT